MNDSCPLLSEIDILKNAIANCVNKNKKMDIEATLKVAIKIKS